MTSSSRLLIRDHDKDFLGVEDERKYKSSEDAVNFHQDFGGGDKELVEILKQNIARVMSDVSSTSHEDPDQKLTNRVPVFVKEEDVNSPIAEYCAIHPDGKADYWCKEDSLLVCKDCLIFGEHRGHTAVKGEEMRSAAALHSSNKMVVRLEEELGRVQEMAKGFDAECMKLFMKIREEVEQLLDVQYELEKSRVIILLTTHCKKLLDTIHSLKSGEPLEPEKVEKLISHPLLMEIIPSTVTWKDTQLSITPPLVRVADGISDVFVHSIRVVDENNNTSRQMIAIPDITTMDGTIVTVVENGTPGQFYCKVVDFEDLEELIADAEDTGVTPTAGQGVLVRLEGRWCRATLLDSDEWGWRCELVDMGQVLHGVKEVDMTNLPHSVVNIPAMAVKCSLAGLEGSICWTKEVIKDWEWMVRERSMKLTVVDASTNTVDLSEDGINLVSRLVFLGHVPPPAASAPPTQQYQPAGTLSTAATLCCDYKQISPSSLLLYFNNPLHMNHLHILAQLDTHPALVGPPGLVQQGSAIIAPWQGSLYRALVLSVTDTTNLTVLYVDHGNTDMVSWWDCYAVPRDFLFPPLATMVRLAGVRPVGQEGWNEAGRKMLQQALDESEGIQVRFVSSEAKSPNDVELMIVIENYLQDVGELLVREGLAEWEESVRKDMSQASGDAVVNRATSGGTAKSERISDASSGTVMSHFLEGEEVSDQIDEISETVLKSAMRKFPSKIIRKEFAELKRTEDRQQATIRQSSSTFYPFLPTKQVFTAMLMSIDTNAVVWVIPESVGHLLSQIIAELGNCVEYVGDISPGEMVVARNNGKKVRGRVMEEEGNIVKIVDIDSGELFISNRGGLIKVSSSLLTKPPLAIPLKLFGVKRSGSTLSEGDRAAVFDKIGFPTASLFWVTVSIMERNLEQLPLPANVRYTVQEEHDGNMALDLVELKLCDVITNGSQWSGEVSAHGLDWMLDPMEGPQSLSFLPHPLPLAAGQWLAVSVEGLEYPLEGGEERDPDINTPDANRIGVQVQHMPMGSVFDQHQEDISHSLTVVGPQVIKFSNSALDAKNVLARCASTAEKVSMPTVGQSVLVFYEFTGEGGEWCRGTVETLQRKRRATVHYTDYGHRGQVEVGKMRSMEYKERMMPVQVREVMFRMPDSNVELAAIRLDLRQEERKVMRVEQITSLGHPMELEEILVSVWRVVEGEEEGIFMLSKIC